MRFVTALDILLFTVCSKINIKKKLIENCDNNIGRNVSQRETLENRTNKTTDTPFLEKVRYRNRQALSSVNAYILDYSYSHLP